MSPVGSYLPANLYFDFFFFLNDRTWTCFLVSPSRFTSLFSVHAINSFHLTDGRLGWFQVVGCYKQCWLNIPLTCFAHVSKYTYRLRFWLWNNWAKGHVHKQLDIVQLPPKMLSHFIVHSAAPPLLICEVACCPHALTDTDTAGFSCTYRICLLWVA